MSETSEMPKRPDLCEIYEQTVGVVREMHAALLHACKIFVVVVRDVGEGSNYILYYNLNYLN